MRIKMPAMRIAQGKQIYSIISEILFILNIKLEEWEGFSEYDSEEKKVCACVCAHRQA
jgi:hypothetical protein